MNLPELIAPSRAAFESEAIRLAKDPASLAALRAKLVANRESSTLFDTQLFCRNLEAAYEEMWARSQRGEAPGAFAVSPGGGAATTRP